MFMQLVFSIFVLQVSFVFTNGISSYIADQLEQIGVRVLGKIIDNFDASETAERTVKLEKPITPTAIAVSELSSKHTAHIRKVNLDVSAMLAYVSSVTNGSCNLYEFSVPVLKQQAKWESERPQKPILDSFFQGKGIEQTAEEFCLHIFFKR